MSGAATDDRLAGAIAEIGWAPFDALIGDCVVEDEAPALGRAELDVVIDRLGLLRAAVALAPESGRWGRRFRDNQLLLLTLLVELWRRAGEARPEGFEAFLSAGLRHLLPAPSRRDLVKRARVHGFAWLEAGLA